MGDQYFTIKTQKPETVEKIQNFEKNIELDGINVMRDELRLGTMAFIVLGGDRVPWEKGLIGIGVVSEEPYDLYYEKRNFKIKIDMKIVFENPITREDLIPFKDCYGIIAIGPQVKGEPNQALTTMTKKQCAALMRAMLDLCPDIEEEIKELADISLQEEIFGPANKLIEIPVNYQEDEASAIERYYSSISSNQHLKKEDEKSAEQDKKICFDVSRSPRIGTLYPLNFILYGAPGTGKTYSTAEYALAIIENRPLDTSKKSFSKRKEVMQKYNSYIKNGQIIFTTFHQSYGYEEFIQGLRPDTTSEHMIFKTVDGVFKQIADKALNDTQNNYVIIIDEINRANISKVFGELITLIEEDKRWGEVNETCATLQSGDVFAVPNNLYIVGTMNSADKSISLIDAALRRRFEFIEQHPDESLVEDPILRNVLNKLNKQLADTLESTDLLIGHSYFMGKDETSLCDTMNKKIIPLLYEYFYDNQRKVKNTLEECLKGLKVRIVGGEISRLYIEKADTSL